MGSHLEDYEITIEFDLNERKADYFASQMIFGRHDLYDYYLSLRHDDFLVNAAHCMKSFKAPYKAVLIQLYQIAKKTGMSRSSNKSDCTLISIGQWKSGQRFFMNMHWMIP